MKTSHKYIDQLIELIRSLNDLEVTLLKKQVLAAKSKNTKMLDLFEFIEHNHEIRLEILLSKFSQNSSPSSFNKLINRLIGRIQDFLITDVIKKQNEVYSESFRVSFTLRKELLKSDVLISKGLHQQAEQKLKKIVIKSKKFEYYIFLLDALYKLLSFSTKLTQTSVNDLLLEIEHYENCRSKYLSARKYYNTLEKDLNATSIQKDKDFPFEVYIKQLLIYAQETNSANIYSYYYLLAMEYSYRVRNIQREIDLGVSFIRLVKDSKVVYSKTRLGYINSTLSNSAISVAQFELGHMFSSNAIYWTKENKKSNLLTAFLTQIKALIYLGNYQEVLKTIDQLKEFDYLFQKDYNSALLSYYKVVNAILLGIHQISTDLINNLTKFSKHKEGWNIWIQILRIQVYLEMEKFSEVEYLIENLRKYLERNKEKYQIKERLFLISKLFIELKTCNFDFKQAAEKKPEVMSKLKSLHEDCRWDGRTPEIILFHDWFAAKVNGEPYQPNFEPYRIDLKVDEAEFESMTS